MHRIGWSGLAMLRKYATAVSIFNGVEKPEPFENVEKQRWFVVENYF